MYAVDEGGILEKETFQRKNDGESRRRKSHIEPTSTRLKVSSLRTAASLYSTHGVVPSALALRHVAQ